MKVLKFGGKSLASDPFFKPVIKIIKDRNKESPIIVVASAIGDTTDKLERLLEQAINKKEYEKDLALFIANPFHVLADIQEEITCLRKLFEGVCLLEDYSPKIKDKVLAQGELIAIKVLTAALVQQGIAAIAVDSRQLFITDNSFGSAIVYEDLSRKKTRTFLSQIPADTIPIVSGFIGQTTDNQTTTLGRDGSNYSASLLANFVKAQELQNYTHVDGIFTAHPEWVQTARKIDALHFDDANEIVHFGASILHAKTIHPLVQKDIPLRIYNTLNPTHKGTLISSQPTPKGIKSLSLNQEVALIQLEGRGLLGKVGIDARVFTALYNIDVSVGLISQGTSERGLGFVVAASDADKTLMALNQEFQTDFKNRDVQKISKRTDIAVISIIGQDLQSFDKPYAALVRNKITPILFNNAVTGKNVSLVVEKSRAKKALNVIHGQIFGVVKIVHLALFGHGLVGGTLIDQILASAKSIQQKKNIQLKIFAIANSKIAWISTDEVSNQWRKTLVKEGCKYQVGDIIDFAKKHHLENLIAIDNTASSEFIEHYIPLVEAGFDLVSSNKIGNTQNYQFYKELRKCLINNHKEYLYETNVGAGLPLIDTIKLLHLSGENITKIKGVFSGSLSYIFNSFSKQDKTFSSILKSAIDKGFTEPDPREDLCGNDVGRKLLVLARELDLENEFLDIQIQNLIPKQLREIDSSVFLNNLEELDIVFHQLKQALPSNTVLRYVGELSGDLQQNKGILETKLVQVSKNSALGQLKGSDSIFEIYTESYGENPIIIQGAGAGASVTARGVFGDIIRLALKG